MSNALATVVSGSGNLASFTDETASVGFVANMNGRHLSLPRAASGQGNHSALSGLDSTDINKNKTHPDKTMGKSLGERTLSVVNQLAAGCSAMAGCAWLRGGSILSPSNVAMNLMQQAPGLLATVCPDCPGLIRTAQRAAGLGYACCWTNGFYTAMTSGNVGAVAATAALCGAGYVFHKVSGDGVSQLCKQFSASAREFGEPWLQAGTRVMLAGALQAAEMAGTGRTGRGSTGRFVVPGQETTLPANEGAPAPTVVGLGGNHSGPGYLMGIAPDMNVTKNATSCCFENGLTGCVSNPDRSVLLSPTEVAETAVLAQAKTATRPVNQTGIGLASSRPADAVPIGNPEGRSVPGGFLPLAEAGLIRTLTREQLNGFLVQAAHQIQELPPQCPDMAGATPVAGSDNGTVYQSESRFSGWAASPDNQTYHYQVLSADPGSLLVNDTDGNQIPAPGLVYLAQVIRNSTGENAEMVEALPPDVAADKFQTSARFMTPVQPRVQQRLDPEKLAMEIGNSTESSAIVVLKPCNAITGQPESSVLVFSADPEAHLTINMGTDGFRPDRSVSGEAPPANVQIRLAPDCITEKSGYVSGRLEMYAFNQWVSICDNAFDSNAASVACRQIGLNGEMASRDNVDPICPKATGSILITDLDCNGNETSLLHCSQGAILTRNCGHADDVTIKCPHLKLLASDCNTEQDSVVGRLVRFHNNAWGSVCNRNVGNPGNGDAICQDLDYSGGVIKNTTSSCSAGIGPISWAVSCNGNGTEASPFACSYSNQTEGCSHADDLVVSCRKRKLEIRFVPCEQKLHPGVMIGRLDMFSNGYWGTICDLFITPREARVACRQLGYSAEGAMQYYSYHIVPKKWLGCPEPLQLTHQERLFCNGSEASIFDCTGVGDGRGDCSRIRHDVFIECRVTAKPTTRIPAKSITRGPEEPITRGPEEPITRGPEELSNQVSATSPSGDDGLKIVGPVVGIVIVFSGVACVYKNARKITKCLNSVTSWATSWNVMPRSADEVNTMEMSVLVEEGPVNE